MTTVLATNITSPLGFTTEENYQAVRVGSSALKRYLPLKGVGGSWGLPEPFAASLFSEEQRSALALDGYTFFEALAIRSAGEALSHIQLDASSPRVILILSTTKGNIGQSPALAAQKIAQALGVSTTPIVVCNACVSGLSAQLLADRLLSAGLYDYAIVVGAEEQSKFIISGFQSLKAVSEDPCRPFDIERNGLNPGEAAATIVFGTTDNRQRTTVNRQRTTVNSQRTTDRGQWSIACGAARNDAYHLVSPSPQGEGCYKAIETVMKDWDKSKLATVCVHGTATLFNDQMESIAIQRAGLSDVPLSALKGYFGHTMGAAGVLETILTMWATDDGIILPSKGFTEIGVSGKVNISSEVQKTDKTSFLKIMSGFGGCNVAMLYAKTTDNRQRTTDNITLIRTHTVRISSEDDKSLADIYKQQIGDYPKFYKMDILSRLAFVAAEDPSRPPLKREEKESPFKGDLEGLEGAIIFNHSSSIVADREFMSTISDAGNFFPSPSAFVYTLPNMTVGEIAIRHHMTGETSLYILPHKDEALMQQILEAYFRQTGARSVISGWVDAESETTFECELSINKTTDNRQWTTDNKTFCCQ